ncbi:amino acid ABC transporter permease [Ovoidimarina sediminis]|uniref:amino acid ABC transporter permease n=1 Tax=Ovoidimarina sediminis TaxID=3079856 RepID=UPI00290D8BC6|nr:amino acid ABC transporter permease [Rhodophyticola sp. MJ-SS7]MDU8946313.1 amino acid ABC transporter permease [Rhodophyticola sp. MJ-SS7]
MSEMHAHSVAFVRETSIPPSPPPAAETGAVKWVRENLFSSVTNSILTLLALLAVYSILSLILPWLLNGIWNTGSRRECLDQLQGQVGGCFSVLTERWHQLIFGRYPIDSYWRPTLAFVLMFVAIAPVLFSALPRKMLIWTGLFPFVAYWLVWGGSILSPLAVLIGFVIGYLVYRKLVDQSFAMGFIGGLIATVLFWWVSGLILGEDPPRVLALTPVESREIGGFMLNMILGVTCVSLSLPLGIALALGRQSKMPIIRIFSVIFIEFIRGVPLITLLFVANVVLAYFLPPNANFDIIVRVMIMITLFAAAYIAEVIRGGLAALPRGQYEAADSLGLDYSQAMRLIILPQALKISIPGIVNVAVGLFKDTTLVSVISMFDLVGIIRGPIVSVTEWQGIYWELYGFAALLFFVCCYGISQYSQWLERQLQTDHR